MVSAPLAPKRSESTLVMGTGFLTCTSLSVCESTTNTAALQPSSMAIWYPPSLQLMVAALAGKSGVLT